MIQNSENVGVSEPRRWKLRPSRLALVGSALALLALQFSFRHQDLIFLSFILAPYAIAGGFLGVLAVRPIALRNHPPFGEELAALVGAAAAIVFPILLQTATMTAGLPRVLPLLLIIGDPVTSYQENLSIARAAGNLFLQGLLVSIAMIKLGALRAG
jgi:NAD/NADP transhydrogenase beta subunit